MTDRQDRLPTDPPRRALNNRVLGTPVAGRAEEHEPVYPRRYERLRTKAEFARVRAEGRSWSSRLLVLQAVPNESGRLRAGIIVSKRLGKAVRRNRVRRQVREAIRSLRPRLRGGWDLVIIARPAAVGASFADVQLALEEVLRRAGILDGPPVASESPAGGLPLRVDPTDADQDRP